MPETKSADLVSGMVYEFPELQGIMGGYYAQNDGIGDAVAAAIRDHYKPLGPGDAIPETGEARAVALASATARASPVSGIASPGPSGL